METRIEYGPAFAWLRAKLSPGDRLSAEAGAMVTRSTNVHTETRLNADQSGGLLGKLFALLVALARKLAGGETMFVNEFSSSGPGEVVLAPHLAGAIEKRTLAAGEKVLVQAGSYLASTDQVSVRLRWGGLKTLFSREGLFLLECAGPGDLFLNAYGGTTRVQIDKPYVVDTGHIVAFDDTLRFKVRSVGGMKSFFLSGEGLVCEFRGRGELLLQSRNISALAKWVNPMLRG